jgi:hypothetical protein
MQIVVSRNISLGAPGPTLGGFFSRDFKSGQSVHIAMVDFPGKQLHPNTMGAKAGKGTLTSWSFWTNTDIDCALIFKAEDISAFVISPDERAADPALDAALQGAPFTVLDALPTKTDWNRPGMLGE